VLLFVSLCKFLYTFAFDVFGHPDNLRDITECEAEKPTGALFIE
jgi:hypothetical protein